MNDIARGAALGSHREYTEYLCTTLGANVNNIVKATAHCGDFSNKTLALHSLAFIKNDKYRAELAKELKYQKLVPYDVTELVPKAQKIGQLRLKYNYSQCIALGNRHVLMWYLHGATLVKQNKFSLQLFLSIATYLSPLTLKESTDLYKKSRFDQIQKLLIKDINKYCIKTRDLFFFNRDKKAEAFSLVCSKSANNEELRAFLVAEDKRISDSKSLKQNNANPYKDLIVKHSKRLG